MLGDATVTRNSVDTPVEAMSRRALLTASAGLLGATALAWGAALAQAPVAPPTRPASQAPVRNDWLAKQTEDILEPGLPIIDPHHHLYDRPRYTYLFPDLLADVGSGHNIRARLYEQAGWMYRADGPEELKSLGETEFVCGVAAMSASGNYGPTRCIAGVVGYVDLRLGSRAKGVLERHIAISDGRIRGIRNGSTWSDDPVLRGFGGAAGPGLYLDKNFREGFATLVALDLTFDAWVFQTQLGDVVDLGLEDPSVESQIQRDERRKAFPEVLVQVQSRPGGPAEAPEHRIVAPGRAVANAADAAIGDGDVSLEHALGARTEAQIDIADDSGDATCRPVIARGTHRRNPADELGLAKRFQFLRPIGSVHGADLLLQHRPELLARPNIFRKVDQEDGVATPVLHRTPQCEHLYTRSPDSSAPFT